MTTLLEKALQVAAVSYSGAKDKAGDPLILHVLRVALDPALVTDAARTVGFLHDILEDTAVTPGRLAAWGFPPEVIDAVVALTRPAGTTYFAYIRALAGNPLARAVKIADLRDHLARKALLPPAALGLVTRYKKALALLDAPDAWATTL